MIEKDKNRVVWLDINASYSHSSLALPAIEAQNPNHPKIEWGVVSGTINSVVSTLVEELVALNPDIIAYTAWLFNHKMLLEVLSRYKTLYPNTVVIGGGAEYLGDNEEYLRRNSFINYVVRGEGEEAFYRWFEGDLTCEGLCYIDGSEYIDNGIARVVNFAALNAPEESKFFDWSKPFVQIESARGCFNGCSFCVSGNDKPLRTIPISNLRERLVRVQKMGVTDIRLLDRTFNSLGKRPMEMLELFMEFEGSLNFHLEVHPALLGDTLKSKLRTMPSNMLHIEAGVQSLSQKVITSVDRYGDIEKVVEGLKFLASLDNMEVHSDLIAGLPFYTLEMIYSDVVSLIDIGCSEIQLELLKVLPGTKIAADRAIKHAPIPPYEVMETGWISYSELQEARRLSRVLDIYYNSSNWQKSFGELALSSSDFLSKFTSYITSLGMIDTPLSQERRGILLYDYCIEHHPKAIKSVTIDWLKCGLSLKRGAGANAVQVSTDIPSVLSSRSGNSRVYSITLDECLIWFVIDRGVSLTSPTMVIEEPL